MLECCSEANSYLKINNNTYYYHPSIWQTHFTVMHEKDNLIHPLYATDFPKARIKSCRAWGPSNVTESYILFWNLFSDRSGSVPFSGLSLSPSQMPAPPHSVTGWQLPARPLETDWERFRTNLTSAMTHCVTLENLLNLSVPAFLMGKAVIIILWSISFL